MITREEIDTIQFSTTRLKEGYDQEEVDGFLDRVGPSFDAMAARANKFEADNGTLRNEIARLRDAVSAASTAAIPTLSPPPTASAERVLALADQTAQRHISEAASEAGRIHSDANAEAGQVKASARAEAAGVIAAAEAERQKILNQLESERVELEDKIDALKSKRSSYRSWLRAALNNIEQEEIDA